MRLFYNFVLLCNSKTSTKISILFHYTTFTLQKEVYEAPSVPLQKDTYYSQEFTAKKTLPEIRRYEPPRENFRRTSAKFDGRTTYQEQHRRWVGQKQQPFGELPSFVGKSTCSNRIGMRITHFI